jgi:hypothetical protein
MLPYTTIIGDGTITVIIHCGIMGGIGILGGIHGMVQI